MLIFSLMTLMADAARVIEIRLRMMALGTSTPAEMFLMVSEKMNAMEEAKAIIARSGNPVACNRKLPEDCRGECRTIVRPSERLISSIIE